MDLIDAATYLRCHDKATYTVYWHRHADMAFAASKSYKDYTLEEQAH
jgi:hypothetical protein